MVESLIPVLSPAVEFHISLLAMASRWHILLHPDFGLGSVTPLGQWVVGRSEVRRGSAYAHLVGLIHGKTVFLEEWGADHTLMGSHPSKEGEGAPEQTRTCPTSTLRAVMVSVSDV